MIVVRDGVFLCRWPDLHLVFFEVDDHGNLIRGLGRPIRPITEIIDPQPERQGVPGQ